MNTKRLKIYELTRHVYRIDTIYQGRGNGRFKENFAFKVKSLFLQTRQLKYTFFTSIWRLLFVTCKNRYSRINSNNITNTYTLYIYTFIIIDKVGMMSVPLELQAVCAQMSYYEKTSLWPIEAYAYTTLWTENAYVFQKK